MNKITVFSFLTAAMAMFSAVPAAAVPLTGDKGMGSAMIGIVVGAVLLGLLAILSILKKMKK
ncbi:MAG: hypothetical protein MJ175_09565 [Clostridia bacterium]|nr:hypothetical protein [Clostridia bacterium]